MKFVGNCVGFMDFLVWHTFCIIPFENCLRLNLSETKTCPNAWVKYKNFWIKFYDIKNVQHGWMVNTLMFTKAVKNF